MNLIRIEVRVKHPDLPDEAASIVDVDPLLVDVTGLRRHGWAAVEQVVDLVEKALGK